MSQDDTHIHLSNRSIFKCIINTLIVDFKPMQTKPLGREVIMVELNICLLLNFLIHSQPFEQVNYKIKENRYQTD